MSENGPVKPEEHELELKRRELAVLEEELSGRERELAAVQGAMREFEQRSKSELDPRYEELANLQARIGELRAKLEPPAAAKSDGQAPPPSQAKKNPDGRRRRPQSPRKLPAQAPERAEPEPPPSPEMLKRLYRDVAKAIHPDLADGEIERQHRHALMIQANEAYDASDAAKLSGILQEWETSPEAIQGQGAIPELIRAIRKIYRSKLRLAVISMELTRLTGTSLYNLKNMTDEAASFDRDLLTEMIQRLDQQIAEAKLDLTELEARIPPEQRAPVGNESDAGTER